jgi:glycyl-tRNA synthetase
MNADELHAALCRFEAVSPTTGNRISDERPIPFNLMFQTTVGPSKSAPAFMRPETAQGIFVNFEDLLYYNGNKLPLGVAQVGTAYRNEISPRAGLLRVREFTLAEIEYFVDGETSNGHPRFADVADLTLRLRPRKNADTNARKEIETPLVDALEKNGNGIITNETLAYFMGRTWLFLTAVAGIDPKRLRFRQHSEDEMAHYANDCWDAEVFTSSHGWIECVGLADRSAYDLTAHGRATGADLSAFVPYPELRSESRITVRANRKALGPRFKRDAEKVAKHLEQLSEIDAKDFKRNLSDHGYASVHVKEECMGEVEVTADMAEVKEGQVKVTGRNIIPGVIEPSFGINRIMYCLLEHAYFERQTENEENKEDKASSAVTRSVLRLPPRLAPVHVGVFPLITKDERQKELARRLSDMLTDADISNVIDTTGASIGKRYARTDEIGIPFALTVDSADPTYETITLRYRDTMAQIRISVCSVVDTLREKISE